jgi:hypothetical protein
VQNNSAESYLPKKINLPDSLFFIYRDLRLSDDRTFTALKLKHLQVYKRLSIRGRCFARYPADAGLTVAKVYTDEVT